MPKRFLAGVDAYGGRHANLRRQAAALQLG